MSPESSTAVANGVLYVGLVRNKVYAFGLPKSLTADPGSDPEEPDDSATEEY